MEKCLLRMNVQWISVTENIYKGVCNMIKHGLTINDFSDINERRRLI